MVECLLEPGCDPCQWRPSFPHTRPVIPAHAGIQARHSRASGNPHDGKLDTRLRGCDEWNVIPVTAPPD